MTFSRSDETAGVKQEDVHGGSEQANNLDAQAWSQEQADMRGKLEWHYSRKTPKTRTGCLTCKYRKKKCNEVRPVCRDCERFGKQCVWADYVNMTGEEIRLLQEKVRNQESVSKMRRRRHVAKPDASKLGKFEDCFVLESAPGSPTGNIPLAKTKKPVAELQLNSVLPLEFIPQSQVPSHMHLERDHNNPQMFPSTKPPLLNSSYAEAVSTFAQPPRRDSYLMSGNSHILLSPNALLGLPPRPTGKRDNIEMPSPFTQHLSNIRDNGLPLFGNNSEKNSPPPMDIEQYHEIPEPFSGSPAAFLGFLKEVSEFTQERIDRRLTLIDDDGEEAKDDDDMGADIRLSPKFNIPGFLEHINQLSNGSPSQFNNLASSFNAAFLPSPQLPPTLLPELNSSGHYLYDYYVDTLSRKVSIAPTSQNESNSYQKVFLPLAQRDKGVLYGILAWSGFHLGGSWMAEGSKYAEMAVNHLRNGVDFSNNANHDDRRTILNKLATVLILCGAEICRGDVKYWSVYLNWGWKLLRDNGGILNFDKNKEEHWLISNFAYHDILASSTTERGTYFSPETYQTIFRDAEGVSRGSLNPLLGVSKSLYKVIGDIDSLSFESKKSLNDYYHRGSSKLTISPTSFNLHSPEENTAAAVDDQGSEISDHGRVSRLLLSIIEKAKEVERSIDSAKPEMDDLINLSDEELELQLTFFESFQLSCKLFLRQSIMKCNPSSLESQVLVNDLIKCIDILIESPMQASLVFPLFIAGIHMVTEDDRVNMKERLDKMIEMYGPWNVVRIRHVIELIWEKNPEGDKVVDWMAVLNELGWEINFA